MGRLIRCECGYIARGATDEDIVAAIRAHLATDHPVLLDTVTQDDLLGWIQIE